MAMKWLFLFIPGVMHDGHYLLERHAQVNDAATPRVRLGRQLSVITRLCQLYNILVTVHITTHCHSTSRPARRIIQSVTANNLICQVFIEYGAWSYHCCTSANRTANGLCLDSPNKQDNLWRTFWLFVFHLIKR